MDYYGNNDWRDYLAHYGTPRHSGRYPWGSGKNPRQGTVGYYQDKGEANGETTTSKRSVRIYKSWDEYSKEFQKTNAEKETSTSKEEPQSIKKEFYNRKKVKSSVDADLIAVNPNHYKNNCMRCTTAFELRRRGYDVEAKDYDFEKYGAEYSGAEMVREWFPKAELFYGIPTSKAQLEQMKKGAATSKGNVEYEKVLTNRLKSQGVGARGNIMMLFTPSTGHSMAYEVTKKGVKLYDAQTMYIYDEKEGSKYLFSHCLGACYSRLDNVDFDPDKISGAVQNRK